MMPAEGENYQILDFIFTFGSKGEPSKLRKIREILDAYQIVHLQ